MNRSNVFITILITNSITNDDLDRQYFENRQSVLFSCVRVFVRQMLDQHLRVQILNGVWRRTTTIATINVELQTNNRQIPNIDGKQTSYTPMGVLYQHRLHVRTDEFRTQNTWHQS